MRVVYLIPLFLIVLNAALCQRHSPRTEAPEEIVSESAKTISFSAEKLSKDLNTFSLSPHPFGSDRQNELVSIIKGRAEEEGASVILSPFSSKVPNPVLMSQPNSPANLTLDRRGTNVWAKILDLKQTQCAIILASHFDTKEISQGPYLGANDCASSSAALLALIRPLREWHQRHTLSCEILAVWFDGEEAVLENWTDGETLHPAKLKDNTYGSRYEAGRLEPCGRNLCLPKDLTGLALKSLILLDMIGSPRLQLSRDSHSTPELTQKAIGLSQSLFPGKQLFASSSKPIEDDHWPYVQRGIRAINLIDFENLDVWHRVGDSPDKLSHESIFTVSRLAYGLAIEEAR